MVSVKSGLSFILGLSSGAVFLRQDTQAAAGTNAAKKA
jgi:hypothetical protein